MLILKPGLYYVDNVGTKHGPIQKTAHGRLHYAGSCGYFSSDGRSEYNNDPHLIAKWRGDDQLRPPVDCRPPMFKNLTDAAKGALLLAQHQGKLLEAYDENLGWLTVYPKDRLDHSECFRIKPVQKRVFGTVEIVDGEPNFKTWKKL